MTDIVIRNASQIVTCAEKGLKVPYVGHRAGTLGLTSGGVAISGSVITAVGPEAEEREAERVIDAKGGIVMPGFVDCHTHAVFFGGRAEEFEQRARGVSYEEIARRGGGIRSSMRKLREASDAELVGAVRTHFDRFLDLGTTTIEAKSGYGLSLKHEIRALRALGIEHDLEVVRTCLAGHTVPPEFEARRDSYINLVCNEILPAVARENLARYCDVFCEQGVFDFAESERMLQAGKKCHLRPRVHADQMSRAGGARLAARVGAITADHLEFVTVTDTVAMREAGVTAVLLPVANHVLDQAERPPARKMISHRCAVAVATDFNPGSAPTQSMPLVLNMACVRFGMSVAEAIVGATINAAFAIDLHEKVGSLVVGKQADVIVCDVGDYRELAYYMGRNPVTVVIKKGKVLRGA